MGKQSFADFLEDQLKGKRIQIERNYSPVSTTGIVESIFAQGGIDEEELCVQFVGEKFSIDCLASTRFEILDEK